MGICRGGFFISILVSGCIKDFRSCVSSRFCCFVILGFVFCSGFFFLGIEVGVREGEVVELLGL